MRPHAKRPGDMFSAFDSKTPYAAKAQVLSKGIEKSLKGLRRCRPGLASSPAQHISNYRYCLTVLKSVKSDLARQVPVRISVPKT